MIEPDRLADRLQDCAVLVRMQGPVTWERCEDWTSARMPRPVEALDDDQEAREREGRSDVDEDDRREDAAAARYHAELAALTKRLDADLARLTRIVSICNPARPKHLSNRDLLVAQVAADGWCVSCWRDDQNLTPITLMPKRPCDVKPAPYYRDLCRACGAWKGEHGQLPPVEILVLWHSGRRVTAARADKALGRSA